MGDAVSHGDANIDVTVFNTGILLAGLCHLAGAVLTLWPQRSLRAKPLWLAAGWALALGAMALVTWATLAGWLPLFFVQGQGGTPVRPSCSSRPSSCSCSPLACCTRISAGASPFTTWYALALLLLAVGLFGIMIQLARQRRELAEPDSPVAGRVHLLLAALAALRESQLPLLPLGEKSRPAYYRDAMAVAMVLAAAAVRLVFLHALASAAPFVTFYPAVILVPFQLSEFRARETKVLAVLALTNRRSQGN